MSDTTYRHMEVSPCTRRQPRPVRLAARLRATRLDRALARGADPSGSALLAARAATLTSARSRRALADALEEIVACASEAPRRRRLAPPRASVLANAVALRELSALMRSATPLYARGIALLGELVTDGAGPLYARGRADALAHSLEAIGTALRG